MSKFDDTEFDRFLKTQNGKLLLALIDDYLESGKRFDYKNITSVLIPKIDYLKTRLDEETFNTLLGILALSFGNFLRERGIRSLRQAEVSHESMH